MEYYVAVRKNKKTLCPDLERDPNKVSEESRVASILPNVPFCIKMGTKRMHLYLLRFALKNSISWFLGLTNSMHLDPRQYLQLYLQAFKDPISLRNQ